MGLCGIPWRDALHKMSASFVNQLLACHWLANGVEIENPTTRDQQDALKDFEQITNREHKWLSEPH